MTTIKKKWPDMMNPTKVYGFIKVRGERAKNLSSVQQILAISSEKKAQSDQHDALDPPNFFVLFPQRGHDFAG
jgi:hypothetical protein